MFRKLLSRFGRTEVPSTTEALQAIEDAELSLRDAQSRAAEVRWVTDSLREQREINHIRERIKLSLGGT